MRRYTHEPVIRGRDSQEWNEPGIVSYAQNAEDVRLWRVFGRSRGVLRRRRRGRSCLHSVTKLFYDAGWSGLNIEPGPNYADARRSPAARHQPRAGRRDPGGRSGLLGLLAGSGLSGFERLPDESCPTASRSAQAGPVRPPRHVDRRARRGPRNRLPQDRCRRCRRGRPKLIRSGDDPSNGDPRRGDLPARESTEPRRLGVAPRRPRLRVRSVRRNQSVLRARRAAELIDTLAYPMSVLDQYESCQVVSAPAAREAGSRTQAARLRWRRTRR